MKASSLIKFLLFATLVAACAPQQVGPSYLNGSVSWGTIKCGDGSFTAYLRDGADGAGLPPNSVSCLPENEGALYEWAGVTYTFTYDGEEAHFSRGDEELVCIPWGRIKRWDCDQYRFYIFWGKTERTIDGPMPPAFRDFLPSIRVEVEVPEDAHISVETYATDECRNTHQLTLKVDISGFVSAKVETDKVSIEGVLEEVIRPGEALLISMPNSNMYVGACVYQGETLIDFDWSMGTVMMP